MIGERKICALHVEANWGEIVQAFIIRRLLAVIPTLLFTSVIVFASIRLIPGDVVEVSLYFAEGGACFGAEGASGEAAARRQAGAVREEEEISELQKLADQRAKGAKRRATAAAAAAVAAAAAAAAAAVE